MKKETKEVIRWLQQHLNHYQMRLNQGKENVGLVEGERENRHINDAYELLRKLPEIESHLSRGGYIQDMNGTPCCDGDEVILTGDNEVFKENEVAELKGILNWDRDHFNIVFPTGKKCLVLYLDTFANFKKVTK